MTHHLQSITVHGRWVCACGERGPALDGATTAAINQEAAARWAVHAQRGRG